MTLGELRLDCAVTQKRGLHFILASIVIWCAILVISTTSLPILAKNFLTFCCAAPLVPLAYVISKIIKVDFSNKNNPLSGLGLLFSLNQLLYLLIAVWVYPTVPAKLVMILAIIFGSHLLPFGWLYLSKSYMAMSVVISLASLIIGWSQQASVVAASMIGLEVAFSLLLVYELRTFAGPQKASPGT